MGSRGLTRVPVREVKSVQSQIEDIGRLFQKRRQKLGLTQEEFAEKIDVSVNMVRYIEQGRRIPSLPLMIRISRHLRLRIVFDPL